MNLFVYGTLCVPEVVTRLLGHPLVGESATLPHYRRALLEGCVFPGIVEDKTAQVSGILFRDLEPDVMSRFDAYEASFYRRVSVMLVDGTAADVYEIPPEEAWRMSETPWDETIFRRDHLADYLP